MAHIILSEQQEAIVRWFRTGTVTHGDVVKEAKAVVIRARAGTGKTFTGLLGLDEAPEDSIVFAAFNKSIADEIKGKLRNPKAEGKTLHGIGYGIVNRNRRGFKVDAKRGTEDAIKACGANAPDGIVKIVEKLASLGKGMLCDNVRDMVEIAYNFDLTPDESNEDQGWNVERVAQCALRAMECAKVQNPANTITYDDMIWLPVVLGWARPHRDLTVVDECQDMNAAQIKLARMITKPSGRIAVIGDDRQAIYGFRGADSGSLDRMKRELNAEELSLTITRRCPKSVVALARTLVPDYEAAPDAPEGTVCDKSREDMMKDAKVGDFILSRKNAPLAGIALAFLRQGKRARIEGKDIGAGLVGLCERVAGKGKLGIAAFLAKLSKHCEKQIAKLTAANGKNMEARIAYIEDQCETIAALSEGCESTDQLVKRIRDLFDVFTKGEPAPAIVCSSVHKSKGREAHTVWLCKDTLYPGGRRNQEEDNIAYVAYTRAQSALHMVGGIS